jgi:plasmid maintenance system antidote protein VapI
MVHAIGLHEALEVSPRLVESITNLVENREVISLGNVIHYQLVFGTS